MVDEAGAEVDIRQGSDKGDMGTDVSVRKDLGRMSLDEARAAFAQMLAVEPDKITSQEDLQTAYAQFPEALSTMAAHLLEQPGTTSLSSTSYFTKWESEDGAKHGISVKYPLIAGTKAFPSPDEARQFRAHTTPAEITLSSERPGGKPQDFLFDYKLQSITGSDADWEKSRLQVSDRDYEGRGFRAVELYEGNPDWAIKDGDYTFAASGIQTCTRVLSERDKAIGSKPIDSASTPPAIIAK